MDDNDTINGHYDDTLFSCCFASSDGETFISADDLRINLWNLEINSQSFNIVDVKPTNMEDLTGKLVSTIKTILACMSC
jgi:serine/threonine-protein phosphatase 2A regulatory subunit B